MPRTATSATSCDDDEQGRCSDRDQRSGETLACWPRDPIEFEFSIPGVFDRTHDLAARITRVIRDETTRDLGDGARFDSTR